MSTLFHRMHSILYTFSAFASKHSCSSQSHSLPWHIGHFSISQDIGILCSSLCVIVDQPESILSNHLKPPETSGSQALTWTEPLLLHSLLQHLNITYPIPKAKKRVKECVSYQSLEELIRRTLLST